MQVFYKENFEKENWLDDSDSRHCVTVLRKKAGDPIVVANGEGDKFDCLISKADSRKCILQILEKETFPPPQNYIHIALAPTKNMERTEYFVEKAVEIGISEISFLLCENSERKQMKSDRIERIVNAAMKQSLHWYRPKVNELSTFEEFISNNKNEIRLIAHLSDNSLNINHISEPNNVCILIGPEGDFTEKELTFAEKSGFQPIFMGKSRLRTETAGVVAVSLLNNLWS